MLRAKRASWIGTQYGDAIDRVVARQPRAAANLVFLGDKSILWHRDRSAFLMYSIQGRSAVALRDPVGPAGSARELIPEFVARCDRSGLVPVFYEVSEAYLDDFARRRMTVLKIGEEARVRLPGFSLEGRAFKELRTALSRIAREGCAFRVADAAETPLLISQLKDVSDEWMEAKGASEKGFSTGYFKREYIERWPVALITRGDHILAFTNVWMSGRSELSADLMRYRSDAPSGTMDALFAHLMLWGRDNGFAWCNLGMAPLAGLASQERGVWPRLGGFVYRHGEAFYNFQGLRAYKQKFQPVWEPTFLVCPNPLALPRALADIAALVAGGYRGIFMRTRRRVA